MSNLRGKRTYDNVGGDKLARELGRPVNEPMRELMLQRYSGRGFCEGCRTYKPAPSPRNKGWRCANCTEVAV